MSYSRVVGRANNNANASGGLVFANANNVSSNSNSNYGARLTFKTYGGSKCHPNNRFYGNGYVIAMAASERHKPRQPSPHTMRRKLEHDGMP